MAAVKISDQADAGLAIGERSRRKDQRLHPAERLIDGQDGSGGVEQKVISGQGEFAPGLVSLGVGEDGWAQGNPAEQIDVVGRVQIEVEVRPAERIADQR